MSLSQQLTDLKLKLMNEANQRMEIEETEAYQKLEVQIGALTADIHKLQDEQLGLMQSVPDSTDEYEAVKRMVLGEMREKGIEQMDNVEAKVRVKREVNTRKLMTELEGDLDNFFLLAKVPQKDLKDFEKANAQFKGLSKSCVEEVSREITDLLIHLPE